MYNEAIHKHAITGEREERTASEIVQGEAVSNLSVAETMLFLERCYEL